MTRTTNLRLSVESALAGRISAPFTYCDRKIPETASTGIPEIDSLAGGLPRGSLTEVYGSPCSGRTSILLSALAARTTQREACALIDGRDAFDPHSAEAAGVKLEHLLWVRCHDLDQSLRATDLLLQGGGFGLVVLDLSDIPPKTVRYIPLNAWFRFRKTVEDTPTILLLLEQEPSAKTCASLVLGLRQNSCCWNDTSETCTTADFPPHSLLFAGLHTRAEVIRSKIEPAVTKPWEHHHRFAPRHDEALFEMKTIWSLPDGAPPAGSKQKLSVP